MYKGQKIKLAPLLCADSPILFNWINNREQVLFNSVYQPIAESNHLSWFKSITQRKDLYIFGLRLVSSNQLIGSCQLHNFNPISRSAELQIRIGIVSERGKGLGTEAIRLLLNFGFRDLNLNRVYLHVFATNLAAINLYKKHGFQKEGILREAVFLDGNFVDVWIMSLLKKEDTFV